MQDPGSSRPDLLLEEAVALHRQGRMADAGARYEAVLQSQPRNLRAVRLLAGVFIQSGQARRAVELINRALRSDPQDVGLHLIGGAAHLAAGEFEPAVMRCDQAIAFNVHAAQAPAQHATAWQNRGIALHELGHHADAIDSFDRALAIAPDAVDAHYHRGNALRGLHRWEEAVASYDAALARAPTHLDACLNRGSTLLELERCGEALESYDRALAVTPLHAEALGNRGAVLLRMGRPTAALDCFDRALAIKPDYGDAHFNRGNALRELRQFASAAASYETAIATRSTGLGLLGLRLNSKTQLCDWRDLDADLTALVAAIERGEPASDPYFVLSALDSARLQRRAAEAWVRASVTTPPTPPFTGRVGVTGRVGADRKIRIGYLSNDFKDHPVAILSAGLYESHDRTAFDVTGFALRSVGRDAMRQRLERGFDRFVDLGSLRDADAVERIRALGLDIAVDLGGFTAGARPALFAARIAPLQVGFLGYTGTLGGGLLDYLVADHTLIPAELRMHYAEKILYLPHSFQVNDASRPVAGATPGRREVGLPDDGFVFCCFNNTSKLMPLSFDGWMRILARVEGSVLWLLDPGDEARRNLRREAATRGVRAERLVFAPRAPLALHLARHGCADLFLDSLPYNAHTTASDALWTGLPVVTRLGEAFSGRVAASLLRATGLPELITVTPQAYEDLAVALATDPERLADLRRRLADNRATAPLFDVRRFTRGIEAGYRAMVLRQHAGLEPAHIGAEPPVTT